jgi:CheY-like chemotaxis protein
MGGTIGVESELGLGSRFWFTANLQLADSAAAREAAGPSALASTTRDTAATKTATSAGTVDARVLLVEDNAVNQQVGVAMLRRLGCRVDLARNGIEAVSMSGEQAYDVILMDCQMPEMDGFEATARIRAREGRTGASRIPIVALTANVMRGDRERCLTAGMDDYLAKPFKKVELVAMISRWAASSDVEMA